MIQYYYEMLNKEQQRAYYAIKTGLEAMAPSFPVPRLSGQELTDIYFMVRMDHPEIFWSVKFSYRYYKDSDHAEMIPEYLFKKNQIMEHQKAMEARVKKIARQAEKLSEKEKEVNTHIPQERRRCGEQNGILHCLRRKGTGRALYQNPSHGA